MRILAEAAERERRGEPFALLTVVWRSGPTSGKVGDRALVTPEGRLHGFIGGACATPTVVEQALTSLADGRPRMLLLGDAPDRLRPGLVTAPMACASDGAMEVHVEPVLPSPQVVAVGRSPVVSTLVALAGALGWRTAVVDDGGTAEDHPDADAVRTDLDLGPLAIDRRSFVVVATQGHYDELALEAALATDAGWIGVVASRRRAATVLDWLRERGVPASDLDRIHSPAGLDLGPVAHEEIAVSVLAALVAHRASQQQHAGVEVAEPARAVDPVCGMRVDLDATHYVSEHDGVTYGFCAAGCQQAFEREPGAFLAR